MIGLNVYAIWRHVRATGAVLRAVNVFGRTDTPPKAYSTPEPAVLPVPEATEHPVVAVMVADAPETNPYRRLMADTGPAEVNGVPRFGRFALHLAGCPLIADHAGDKPCVCIDNPGLVGL